MRNGPRSAAAGAAAAPLQIPADELDLAQMLVEAGVPLIEIGSSSPPSRAA